MSNIRIEITKQTPPPAPLLYKVRGYGDPVMVDLMGLDTNLFGVGNFQNVCLYDPNNSSFGAVTNYQRMDTAALDYLKSIQPPDFDITRKMNWLGVNGGGGRPYMVKDVGTCWGLMVFGYNYIQVERNKSYVFNARYQSRSYAEPIEMFKIIGLRKSDMARPVTELIADGLIQHATEAFYPSNNLGETPRGVIYNPVWSAQDYPTNTGAREVYIPKAFLFL